MTINTEALTFQWVHKRSSLFTHIMVQCRFSWFVDGFPPPGVSGTQASSVSWLCLPIVLFFPFHVHLIEGEREGRRLTYFSTLLCHTSLLLIIHRWEPIQTQDSQKHSLWVSSHSLTTIPCAGESESWGTFSCLCCYSRAATHLCSLDPNSFPDSAHLDKSYVTF